MKQLSTTITAILTSFEALTPQQQLLLQQAAQVRKNSQSPYSNYAVGVALLAANGAIYAGCNVERCTYSQCTHAEQNAIDTMIAASGTTKLVALAVVPAPKNQKIQFPCAITDDISTIEQLAMPCGHCLQIIWENCFGDPNVQLLCLQINGQIACTTIADALPMRFGPQDLGINY